MKIIPREVLPSTPYGGQLRKYVLFFKLMALSATVPLFVSLKLHPHYLIPSYPRWPLELTSQPCPCDA